MSMMGDAISHTVLPGLAIAFLITNSRDSLPMFVGAVVVGVITALLVHVLHRFSRLEEGASMGVVFTTLFAIGLILIRKAADHVDLDPGCVLYGAVELTPLFTNNILGFEIPRAALTNGAMLLLNGVFVLLFYKELKISSFDPELSTTLGFNANLMHYALMTLVAATCVAAFESVGSIIVIAMLIVPGACAHLLTNRLGPMLLISLVIAALCAVLGHVGVVAMSVGGLAGVPTAGMMGVMAGVIFTIVFLASPSHGLVSRVVWQALLGVRITRDDVLGYLYRKGEIKAIEAPATAGVGELREALPAATGLSLALWLLRRKRFVESTNRGLKLTADGKDAARRLIRSHRLWEDYLVKEFGLAPERVHRAAEDLEHVTDQDLQSELDTTLGRPKQDPHGHDIPDKD
jgi:manganese/zinc/iron transport system permease protein